MTDSPERVQLRPVVLTLALISIFFGVVALILYFKPFGDSPPAGKPELDVFAAGPVDAFPLGSVTYFEDEHVYLVHFDDGAFLALYDLSPATQALVTQGGDAVLECRAVLTEGDEMAALLGPDVGTRGFASTGFVDACTGAVWDAEGTHVGGPADARLDRFPVAVINDIVRIDLADRRCKSEAGIESPCIPTQ
jgi:hypothetical protein